MDNKNNIYFLLEESNGSNEKEEEGTKTEKMIQNIWFELDKLDNCDINSYSVSYDDQSMYYLNKEIYGNDEIYYDQEYTVKDLLKICQYYGMDKHIKSAKCKKYVIISSIVYFESLPENVELVQKRHKMWDYIMELNNDPKMKKYVIWN
jgi:hypothetical protein